MKTRILYTFIITLLLINPAFAQWIQTDGPYGNIKVTSIFENDNQLYASTSCGLHNVEGVSQRWQLKATMNIEAYAQKGDSLFFGGPNLGIQLLNLSDQSFKPVPNGLAGATVFTIKNGGNCVYAGVENSGFYKSDGFTNTGGFYNRGLIPEYISITGNPSGGMVSRYHVYSIETLGDTLFCGTDKGVYKSPANVIHWVEANNLMVPDSVQLIKAIDGNLYACAVNALYHSSDGGNSWTFIKDFESQITSVNKWNNSLLITTLGSGISRSDDGGLNWVDLSQGLEDRNVTTLTIVEDIPVCGTMTRGIYVLEGNTWVNNSKGMICSTIMSMVTTGTSIVANDDENVFTLSANTTIWDNISPLIEKSYFGSVAVMGETIFLSYKKDSHESVITYYTPGNRQWADLNGTLPKSGQDASLMRTQNNNLYVYEEGVMHYTSDFGSTWTPVSIPLGFCPNFVDFEIFNGMPFAATCGNGELLSLSSADNWQLSGNGLPADKDVTSLAYSSDAIYAHMTSYGMFVSKDNGQSWTSATNGFNTGRGIHSHAFRKQDIFITSAKSVFYSIDYGENWNSITEGLPNTYIGPMVIFNDTLFVGTHGNGVWKREIASIPSLKSDTTIVGKHIRIYPNPATEYVRIDIAGFNVVKVQLIDMLGRVLIDTPLGVDQTIAVDHLISGAYVLLITTDKFTYNSKLIKK